MIMSKFFAFFVVFGLLDLRHVDSTSYSGSWSLDTTVNNMCQLSSCSQQELHNSSYVFTKCSSNANLTIRGHCCMELVNLTNVNVLGIDLSNCNVTNTSHILPLKQLKWLVLEENPLFNDTDFDGLSDLDYLSLPSWMSCPGGDDSWLSVNYTSDLTVCEDELNSCITQNVSCPADVSSCHPNGPGQVECLCDGHRYGYKCLRSSHFPYLLFILTLCGLTLVVSVFLGTTQRIRVKRKKER